MCADYIIVRVIICILYTYSKEDSDLEVKRAPQQMSVTNPQKIAASKSLLNLSALNVQKIQDSAKPLSRNDLKYRPLPELPPSADCSEHQPISEPVSETFITFADLATNYSEQLPGRVEVCRGVYGDDEDDAMCISTGDIYNIHYVKRRETVTLQASAGNKDEEFAVPLNSSIKFSVLYDPGRTASKAAEGYIFSKVMDIINASPMPKVVCATKRNTASKVDTIVTPGEILVVVGVEDIQGSLHLKMFSLKTETYKLLPGDSTGQFTTKPKEVQMYISQILKYCKCPIPSTVLIFPSSEGQMLPEGLRSRPFTLLEKTVSTSLVATIHLTNGHEILDIPSTLDAELKWVQLSEKERFQLKENTSQISKTFDESKVIRYRSPNQSDEEYMTQEELYTSVFGHGWGTSIGVNSRRSSLDASSILGDSKLAPDMTLDKMPSPGTPTKLPAVLGASIMTEKTPNAHLCHSPHHSVQLNKHASVPNMQQYGGITQDGSAMGNPVLLNSEHGTPFCDAETYDRPRATISDMHNESSDSVFAHELYDQPRRISIDAGAVLASSKAAMMFSTSPHALCDERDIQSSTDVMAPRNSPIPPQLPERDLYNVVPQRERRLAPKSPPLTKSNKCLPSASVKPATSSISIHSISSDRPQSALSESFPNSANYLRNPSPPLHDYHGEDRRRVSLLKSMSPVPFLQPSGGQSSALEGELQIRYETLAHEFDEMKEKLKTAESRIDDLQRQISGLLTQNLSSPKLSSKSRLMDDKSAMDMDEVSYCM